ncbi:MAG: TSCPD domain-containing protein, partial [Promethearchaeota archaeon]
PELALVKYKKMVGGGHKRLWNVAVQPALERLGYSDDDIKIILLDIKQHETIEKSSKLQPEHLKVFDCSFPGAGTRSICYSGHIKMMSAVQSFLSGAISKTVNMPEDSTIDDIEKAYIEAWKAGLKCIAIYRDNSKRIQPLSTKKESKLEFYKRSLRRKLPDERASITHKFSIAGHDGYVTVGLYEDNTPGELFIIMSKSGSTIAGLMDSFATSISIALQYGVPIEVLINKFLHTRFEPAGFTGNTQIPIAKSIMDYIFRWLKIKFVQNENGSEQAEKILEDNGRAPTTDAPACPECGSITERTGTCYRCPSCGTTTGCG